MLGINYFPRLQIPALKPTIGIAALQGDFSAHGKAFTRAGAQILLIRTPDDLKNVQALALPGGESTTMTLLGYENGLWQAVAKRAKEGMPVFATCAGVIMLAARLERETDKVRPLGLLDIAVSRNAYGSQVESFESDVRVKLSDEKLELPGVFIRAPVITEVSEPTIAAGWLGGQVVFVVKGNVWGLTFHPELSGDLTLHKRFLKLMA